MDFLLQNAYWIALLPALAFPINVARKWKEGAAATIGVILIGLAWVWSVALFATTLTAAPFSKTVPWIPAPYFPVNVGFQVDHLTTMMLLVVTTVSMLVQVYSMGYMHGDPKFNRFYAYLGLFTAAMLGLVLANNWLLLMICWELVGVSSYLLIGFWFEKPSAMRAAKKAFIVTRVGDLGLLLGIIVIWNTFHTFDFNAVRGMLDPANTAMVAAAGAAAMAIFMGAVGKSAQFPLHVWLPDAMEGPTPVSALIHAATMVAAGVYLVGRSFFLFEYGSLHTFAWPIVGGVTPLGFVRVIGVLTLFIAATIAVAQNDIKRVLAYSTVSQLGYMIMAIGTGAWVAGLFHLMTHAAFKALLFLGSGSVIHGTGSQDMREMGGLWKKMPSTFWTYLIGFLALAGFPLTAGFWSKDSILDGALLLGHSGSKVFFAFAVAGAGLTAFYMTRQMVMVFAGNGTRNPSLHVHESPFNMTGPLWVLAIPSLVLGFVGVPRNNVIKAYLDQPAAVEQTAALPSALRLLAQAPNAAPTVTDAVPAAGGMGEENTAAERGSEQGAEMPHYLQGADLSAPTVDPSLAATHGGEEHISGVLGTGLNPTATGWGTTIALLGIALGLLIYVPARRRSDDLAAAYAAQHGLSASHGDAHGHAGHGHGAGVEVDARGFWHEPLRVLGPVWTFLENKWYFDELWWAIAVVPTFAVSAVSAWVDRNIVDGLVNLVGWSGQRLADVGKAIDTYVVDGIVNGFGWITDRAGRSLRLVQTGRVQNYAVILYLGALILVALGLFRIPVSPQPGGQVPPAAGAAPGSPLAPGAAAPVPQPSVR